VAFVLVMLAPSLCSAEWQIRPYLGIAFAGDTTIVDPELAVGKKHWVTGVSGTWLGNVLGVEADLSHLPGFFQTDEPVFSEEEGVAASSMTTLTGNVVLALPRKVSQYSLRPYVAGGGGLIRMYWEDARFPLVYRRTLAVLDVGGGVTGFLTDRVGVSWDLRYFRSVKGPADRGQSIGAEQMSFWRAMMGVAVRVGERTR
jgi:hypothetical protein